VILWSYLLKSRPPPLLAIDVTLPLAALTERLDMLA
jgi:hypothetical protein